MELPAHMLKNTKGLYAASSDWEAQTRDGTGTLYLNSNNNESMTRLWWRTYQLTPSLGYCILWKQRNANASVQALLLRQGWQGTTHLSEFHTPALTVWVASAVIFSFSLVNCKGYGGGYMIRLAGTFVDKTVMLNHSPKFSFEDSIPMSDNEVKNLNKIKCELRFSEGNSQQ